MTSTRAPEGRRLLPAVLGVCALTCALTGWRLAAAGTVAEQVTPASTLTSATSSPTPAAAQQARRPAAPGWPRRVATPGPVPHRTVPERLSIPALGLSAPVRPTGVDARGAMELPDRPTEVGWYAYGAAPGERRGVAVLAGHVDSERYGRGPLAALARLERGDRVEVTGPSGRLGYEVIAVQRVSKRALDPDELFDRDGDPLLRVVTCAGVYDPDRGGYQDNLVVTARPR